MIKKRLVDKIQNKEVVRLARWKARLVGHIKRHSRLVVNLAMEGLIGNKNFKR